MTRRYHAGMRVIYAGQTWEVIGVDLQTNELALRSLATGIEVEGISVLRVTFVPMPVAVEAVP